MTELWDRNFSQSEIQTAFEAAISDMPRYAAGEERRSLTSAELAIGEWSKNHDRRNTRNWPFATYCTAAQPRSRTGHSGNRQAAYLSTEGDAIDPLRSGARRALSDAEHCSNMNVINVIAKKAENRSGAGTVTRVQH